MRNEGVDTACERLLDHAPDSKASNRVHKEAHGLVADEIHEVKEGK